MNKYVLYSSIATIFIGCLSGCSSEQKENKTEIVKKADTVTSTDQRQTKQNQHTFQPFNFTSQEFLDKFQKTTSEKNRFTELTRLPEAKNSYYFADQKYGTVITCIVDKEGKIEGISIVKGIERKDLIENNLNYQLEMAHLSKGIKDIIRNIGKFNPSDPDSLIHGDLFLKKISESNSGVGIYKNIKMRMIKPKREGDMIVINYVITPYSE